MYRQQKEQAVMSSHCATFRTKFGRSMDNVLETLAKGLLRGLALLVVEIIFGKLCYVLGWPVCKLLSFGKYPDTNGSTSPSSQQRQAYWCSFAGLVVLLIAIVTAIWLNT
jgi:hypothetical protein